MCGSMVRLPNKRSDPDYYDTVVNPIDIMKIQQKLKTDEYETMEDLKSDFELMVANTCTTRGAAQNTEMRRS